MAEPLPDVLQIPLPTPYPVGDVNVYLAGTDGSILVDTGVFSRRSLDSLEAQIEAGGQHIEDVQAILLTHDHIDHAGAVLHLSQKCRAVIYAHPRSALQERYSGEQIERLIDFLVQCGFPRAQVEASFKSFKRTEVLASRDTEPHEIRRVKGGDTLELGGLTIEVLETPGHSPDHLCYRDVDSGVLFSGDTLLPHITPNPLLSLDALDGYRRDKNLLRYMDSIRTLKTRGATRAYPGHGWIIDDVDDLIDRNLAFIEQRRESFLTRILAGIRQPAALAASMFGSLDMTNQYLAISETVAYLDLLERDGQVTVDWDAPVIEVRLGLARS